WLVKKAENIEERHAVLHALESEADNAEGVPIPHFLSAISGSLPTQLNAIAIPNYVHDFLRSADNQSTDTFLSIWRAALANEQPQPVSVLEAACGSANDYR